MNWRGLAAGWLAFGLTNLALVLLLFAQFADLPRPVAAPVPPVIGFVVYVTLAVLLFGWTAQRMRSPWAAALALGGSQFLLVNVDMVLRGDRAVETALASTVVMVLTWTAPAWAWYMAVAPRESDPE